MTSIEKQVAINIYGDWETENLLWMLKKRKTGSAAKKFIRFVLSTRG
jgi:hypothetical protein